MADFRGKKVYKQWRPPKIHKIFKIAKCYKIIKRIKIFKMVKSLFKSLPRLHRGPDFSQPIPLQPLKQEVLSYLTRNPNMAFMTCIIKVNASKYGWQKAVLKVIKNFKGARFKMDQSGVVEVSGLGDPNLLLKKLGKSRKVEVHWFQFGQCSNNLFMPQPKKDPPQAEPNKPNLYNGPWNNMPPPYWGYNRHPYQTAPPHASRPIGYGYGYGYGPNGYPYPQPPRVFRPFALY